MEAMDYVGLFPTLIDIVRGVRDGVVGYDDQIMKRFDHAIAKALKPTAKYDDLYIKNAMLHVTELIGLLVQAYDNPVGIEDIDLPSYINKEEFRRLYNQTQKDKELVNVLKDEWNYYISKDTNKRVKVIQAEIVILADEIKKVGEGVGEVKEVTEKIQNGLSELKGDVNEGINKIINRLDEKEDKKGGNRNEDLQHLCDCLKEKLENKRKHHPSFRLMDIDDDLFPDGMVTFDTEARDSNNELKTVREIIAESWKRGETNHLMIEGEGGIGKTVTLLSLPDKFAPHDVPAIYIPLHELKEETNTIEKYIKNRILDSKEQYDLLQEVVNKPWMDGPNLLLLLDGFNEIPVDLREAISEDIEQWSELPGLQIITSSRFDIHQYVALRSSFSKIELQPLSEETVVEFLENNKNIKIGIPKNPAVIKLITIPLLLTLYIKAEAIRNDRPSPFAKFKETKNAGLLIWNYLQCELWRYKNKKAEAKASVLAQEFIAPYIAWTMQQYTEFKLDESSFFDRIDEAYHLLKSHVETRAQLPDHIKTTLRQSIGLPSIEHIGELLKEHLCLFINNEGEYRLMHQQFRDALAAMHYLNLSYLAGDSLPQEWNAPIDHYVMQFVADLISEDEANGLWELNRKTQPIIEYVTINQLRLQGLLHNNDFSHLDFSGLDLSNISLYPYRCKVTLKLPSQRKRMNKTKLSDKTFSTEGHEGSVEAIAVTPDGKRIVSGSGDSTIRVWDIETGSAIGRPIEGHKYWVRAVAVTPDGKRIVSGAGDHTIRVWNMETGTPMGNPIEGHKNAVYDVAVTPNGKRIVSGSGDYTIRVWDMETGAALGKPIEGHKDWVTTVAVTPDGKRIVSGSGDNTIRVWDMETGAAIGRPIEGHEGSVNAIALTPDGKHIISGTSKRIIHVWDIEKAIGKPIERHEGGVTAVTVTPDGKRIISGSWDSTIRVWDLETGAAIGNPIEGHQYSVSALAVTPDGKRIISGSNDRSIRVWDVETGAAIGSPIEGIKKQVQSVAVTADGKYLVSKSSDCIIRVWDLETGAAIGKPIEGQKGRVNAVAMTPDGKRIVSGSGEDTIRVWDIETGAVIGKPIEGQKGWVNAIAVTPDGKRIVSGSKDCTICVWDLETGAAIRKPIEGHEDSVTAVAVTPDGKRIVSVSDDRTIRVWDMETGAAIGKPIEKKYYNMFTAIAVKANGGHLVLRSWNRHYFMNMKTGKEIENSKEWYEDSGSNVTLITKMSYAVSDDDTIRIFDEGTRQGKTIKIHPLSFVGLDFSLADISDIELKEALRQNGAKV